MRITSQFTCLIAFAFMVMNVARSQTTLIPFGDVWRYLDNGTNQGTGWRSTTFNDAAWKTGSGKFGYGITDAKTTISYGTNAKKKYITTYFRKNISIDVSSFISFTASVKRDDGVIVYINSVEVYRNNIAKGSVNYNTLASNASDNGTISQNFTLNTTPFKSGTNVIAVEIHQQSASTPDMAFDFMLTGNMPPKDVTPPTVLSINRQVPLNENSNASTLTFRTTFSEKVTGVDTSDFTISSTSITGIITNIAVVGSNGSTYDVTVVLSASEGTLRLDLKQENTSIMDAANNSIAGGFSNGQIYTIDLTAPTITAIVLQSPADASPSATSIIYRATFSEAVLDVNTPDFIVTILSGELLAAVTNVSTISNLAYDITISTIKGNGVLRLDVKGSGILDIAGNSIAADYTDGPAYTIEQIPDPPAISDLIVTYNDVWKYLDDGSDQGTSWQATNFNDDNWMTGNGKFGYGINDAATVISYGNDINNKYITTYFRKTISINDASIYNYYAVSLQRDDGVVVYINGKEVYRNNMPAGNITYQTLAPAGSGADDGATPLTFTISSDALITGTNVIAVEIHQYSVTSSDISFDMEMTGKNGDPPVVPQNILYYEGFESGTGFAGMTMQTSTTYGFTVVSSPTYRGKKVGRWELRVGDPPVANGTRAEVLFSSSLALEETWHSFAGYFPTDDYMEEAHSEMFNQWHQGISGLPMLTFSTMHDKFIFQKRGYGSLPTIDYDLGQIPKDTWTSIVIHVKQHLTNGIVQVWINGELKMDVQGGATMFDGPYGRWKMGLYKSMWNNGGTTNSTKRVWYVDEVKIGNATATYEFMKPSGDNISTLLQQASMKKNQPDNIVQPGKEQLIIYPSFTRRGTLLTVKTNIDHSANAVLCDITGRTINTFNIIATASIETSKLHSGIYFIYLFDGRQLLQKQKFVITEE